MFPRSTLSFSAFHEKHFSSTSQSSFFEAATRAEHHTTEEEDAGDSELRDEQHGREQYAPDDNEDDDNEKHLPHHVQQLRTWLRERQLMQKAHQHLHQYPYQQHYDPYWMYQPPSSSGGWHADPQAAASEWWSSMHPPQDGDAEGAWHDAEGGANNNEEGVEGLEDEEEQEEEERQDKASEQLQPAMTLTKEAIAIFEFSRRFREQKMAAAKLEKEKTKRLRAKRRRTAMLGFAMGDVVLSDEDEEAVMDGAQKTMGRSVKRGRGDDNTPNDAGADEGEQERMPRADISDDDNDDDEDDDFGPLLQELPANDTSFLSIPLVYYERMQDKLYGGSLKSLEKQAHPLDPPLSTTPDAEAKAQAIKKARQEMVQIQYLESLLDRSYEDSLQPSTFPKDDDSIALWPGMPLRC
ncbi:hypothetical protein DFQ27_002673 [Actinomortierella ambigua]|uniref:Uncharacterized protein n=1 Tax=Actinomortierella ambigua TaxID=1343610 RepID=A0A9P6U5Z0_9FUNG|nr:hypothetical protein DFQ27_002673 [Actinomortierella ambigua]